PGRGHRSSCRSRRDRTSGRRGAPAEPHRVRAVAALGSPRAEPGPESREQALLRFGQLAGEQLWSSVVPRVTIVLAEAQVHEIAEPGCGELLAGCLHVARTVALEAEQVTCDLTEEPVQPLRVLHMRLDRQREDDVVLADLVGVQTVDV